MGHNQALVKKFAFGIAFFALVAFAALRFGDPIRALAVRTGALPSRTVAQVLAEHGADAKAYYVRGFQRGNIAWPPKKLQLVALKREKRLEVWCANAVGDYQFISEFPILAMSGGPGPKRKEGDRQVPEGFYFLTDLNPNSRYNLSVKVGYPNPTDRKNAEYINPGGDIFVHGSNVSIGCIAIGDDAIEHLFCLIAQTPARDRRILIAPCDFRAGATQTPDANWVKKLYQQLSDNMRKFQR